MPAGRIRGPDWQTRRGHVATLLAAACLHPVLAGDAPASGRKSRLDVLLSASVLRTANRNDAVAALRAWAEVVAQSRRIQLECSVSAADTPAELQARVREGVVKVLFIDPLEYFELPGLADWEASFLPVRGGQTEASRFLLLGNPEAGTGSLTGLRGKNLTTYSSSRADLGRMWAEVLLAENGMRPGTEAVRFVAPAASPSAAVLPVFFGRLGAGVVDRGSYEVLRELNPQLGARLRVLAESPPLAESVLCIHRQRVDLRDELVDAFRLLHTTPAGQQMLLVFRASRLVPVPAGALERVDELRRRRRRLGLGGQPEAALRANP